MTVICETLIEYDDDKRKILTYLATGVVESIDTMTNACFQRIYKDGTSEKYTYDRFCNKNSETDHGNTLRKP